MANKKEAREFADNTGNNETNIVIANISKNFKRKRTIQYEIVRKWTTPTDVRLSQKNST